MRPNRSVATLLLLISIAASAAENNPVRHAPAAAGPANLQRIIVKFRSNDSIARQKGRPAELAKVLSQRFGMTVKATREIAPELQVLQLESGSMQSALDQLRANPDVEYAEADVKRHVHAVPNDPLFVNQWYWQSVESSAVNTRSAWNVTTGAADMVIAVVDTGVRFEHPDLRRTSAGGRLLNGRDFVDGDGAGSFITANDGDGWDADASDPGDWVDAQDQTEPGFGNCDISDSSWHGTRVSGIVGARTNNVTGVAGGTWEPSILPVRVLGKCGGYDSDILAGMRWAAGLNVATVPLNSTPAKIINMSLGATSACSMSYRNLVEQLETLGVLVVVSAGNEAGAMVDSPANCPGVLGVAGLRHAGSKVGFSNIGPEVGVSAPGGNCVNTGAGQPCLFSIDTTTNLGDTTPGASGYTDQFNTNLGTSFSAPIVSVAAALVRSVNTHLTPAQTILRLQRSAAPFPVLDDVPTCTVPTPTSADQDECNCTKSTCGAGMVDARSAVVLAQRPFVVATASSSNPAEGDTVTLDGSESFATDNRTIATYAWTVVSPTTGAPELTGADTVAATFVAPTVGAIRFRLTVTDSEGEHDFGDVVVTSPSAPPPPPPPPPPSSGGGGGGSLDLLWLLVAGLALIAVARRRAGNLSASIHAFAAPRRRACPARRAWRA